MSLPGTATSPIETLGENHLRRLLYASQAFNSTIDLDVLIPRILDMVVETCEAEAGSLWVIEGDGLQCQYAVGPAAQKLMWVELPLGAGIVGDVAVRRRGELIRDARTDPRYLHQIDEITGLATRSVIAVPLSVGNDVYGVIELVNARTGATDLDQEDLHFVEAIADDAAAAFRNAKLFQAERRARDLRALLEVSHEITSTFDVERVLVSVVNLAGRALRFDRCALAVWHDEKLTVRAISGETTVDRRAAAVRELERFLLWADQRREAISIADVNAEEDDVAQQVRTNFPGYIESAAVAALLSVPIKDSEGVLGWLQFEFAQPTVLAQWEIEAATLLANNAALAIRNAQLYANVPFISWLEPLRARKQKLVALPGPVWLAYSAVSLAVAAFVLFVPVPMRVSAAHAQVRALVQRPARSEISGVIDAVLVHDNQFVRRGTPVARVRNESLLRDWREAAAQRDIAERSALAADARGDHTAAALARVNLAEATQAEEVLRAEMQRSVVRAPVSGNMLTQRIEERVGSFVSAGDTLGWIGDRDWVELEAPVKQEDLGFVRIGARVHAKSSAYPNRRLSGSVMAIAPRATVTQTDDAPSYIVRARVDNRDHLLRPGMSVYTKIAVGWRPLASVVLRRPWRWLRMKLWW